ncbi:TonB-dependent receptor domain-containing protein [Sphingosinicella sp.]|uniref:TonB-dependent receptor domain-containing protein n=1 Tax=Sphingosinicella sp. TaxID=1917971 RepID=UPI0040378DFA
MVAIAAATTSPAWAQSEGDSSVDAAASQQGTPAAASADVSEPAITVTGSRIRRPNLESTIPITSIGGEQIFQGGDPNLGETLNELPQLRSTFSQQNPGAGIGIAGLNLLDLRGLGTQRTLVLVNGRRHVASDITNNAVSTDISSIPNDLIERVDIVTGGNSAIYGSDAIAGVVNFVLRRNFDGLQVRGQAGIAEEGFGANQFISVMYGRNIADGAGNITLHGEYSRNERVFASDIPEFRTNNGLFVVDTDSGGLPNNSDGFPDRIFIRDVRQSTINPYGLTPISQRTGGTPLCGVGTAPNNGGPNNNGTPNNCNYIFTPDGRLIAQTGARFGVGPNAAYIGGNGSTGREGNTLSVLPFLERYNANLLARYEFSQAFEVFAEAKFTRVNALGNNAGPSFMQGQFTQFDFRERPRLDNPFLNPADRTTLAALILASGCNTELAACPAAGNLTAAQQAQIAAGTYRFLLARNLLDIGLRDESFRRDTFRAVAGVRGTFNTDWGYEISANYGRMEGRTTTDGFIDRQRFVLAMDAGRDPVAGTIRCRSQFDPAAAVPIQRSDPVSLAIAARNAARLAADIAACVPYNPFGAANNRASIDYFASPFSVDSRLEQLVFSGFVSGDTSDWFELPGGPVRFAIGAEHRREQAYFNQDDFVTDGFTNGVSIPLTDPDPFEVNEVFAELEIPILRDRPFFHQLTVSGAARAAFYQGDTGTVWSYNANLVWAPIRDIRFRANYSRAVRAPNLSETSFPQVPNFATVTDPCELNQINTTSANRRPNCIAAIGANLGSIRAGRTYSLGIVSGSNPDLFEESSDSWTIGAVIQPRFIPGLSLSVDYYNITVNDVIVSVAAQTIINSCYDSPTLTNPFCPLFTRFAGPGTGPSGEQPGEILFNSLLVAPLNFAAREREGIDVNLNYRVNLGAVQLNSSLIYTHNLTISNFQDPVNPNFENRILGEMGDPADELRWDVDLTYGPFTFGYRFRFIGPMYVNAYEDFNALNTGQPGATPPGGGDADFAEPRRFPSVTYHDFRIEWNVTRGNAGNGMTRDLRFYVGVDNLLDRMPPLGSTATGVGTAIYEFRGRNFFAGFRARF